MSCGHSVMGPGRGGVSLLEGKPFPADPSRHLYQVPIVCLIEFNNIV